MQFRTQTGPLPESSSSETNNQLTISIMISKYRSLPIPAFTNIAKPKKGEKTSKKTGPHSLMIYDVAYLYQKIAKKEINDLQMNFYDEF